MDGPEGATLYHPKQSNPFKGMLYQQLLHDIGTDAQGSGGVNKNPWLFVEQAWTARLWAAGSPHLGSRPVLQGLME